MSRRLEGVTVVLTRRPEDDHPLAAAARALGARVIELPCIRVEPLADPGGLAAALAALTPDDLLVITSRAGADAVVPVGGCLPCAVAAVGRATAERAEERGLRVTFVPSRADGRTLARELPIPSGRILMARSDLADADAPAILRGRGARVVEVVAYRTIPEVQGDVAPLRRALERGAVALVVASPSAVDALAAAVDASLLRRAAFVVSGERTAARVRERVGAAAVVASPDPDALLDAIPRRQEAIA